MTTMSGQGACPNAAPVARLQAELEQTEGELVLARAEITTLRLALYGAQCQRDDYPRLFESAWETVEKARGRRPYLYEVLEVVAGRPVPVDVNDDLDDESVTPDTLVCW